MEQLVISTGLKTYEIKDENGDVRGTISINPSDTNILVRANEVEKTLNSAKSKIDELEGATRDEQIALIEKLDLEMKDSVNYLFQDNNASNVVFGSQNVLNTLNGVTFIERFLNAIMPVIEKEVKRENKASEKHIAKYTNHLGK